MTECESVRGKWGEICPDCGVRLPNPKPLQSWMAEKYAGSQKHIEMALILRDSGKAQRFRLHRKDRRAA